MAVERNAPVDSTITVSLTVKGDSYRAEDEVRKRLWAALVGWYTEPAECVEGYGYPDGTLLIYSVVHRRAGYRPE